MLNLGKKLSSVLLCGSMAVTLLGNSGVHAADEIAEAIEDESKEVTAVDEHDDKVENDDKGNENTELDTVKEYQYVAKEDVPAQNPAERSGSSFAVNVAKGLGTVALGTGIGIGADEGVRRFKRDSSGNEAGGQAPIVSKDGTKEVLESQVSELQKKLEGTKIGARELQKKLDGTKEVLESQVSELQKKLEGAKIGARELQKKLDGTKEVLESQVSELQKKLEEDEKIYNFARGAIGVTGWIPKLRDMVSSWLGRDIDVRSKAAITGVIISHAIGIVLFLWNLIKLCNKPTRLNSKKGIAYTTVVLTTDVYLPPVGFILEIAEMVINEFKRLDVNEEINDKKVKDYLSVKYSDEVKKLLGDNHLIDGIDNLKDKKEYE